MHPYAYIKKEWIVSPTACRIYRASAWISVALFIALVEFFRGGAFPVILGPAVPPLLFVGALGAGITIVGMEIFLFRYDDSAALKQIVWFLIMVFPLLGPALYCFFVYSRSEQVRKCMTTESAV